MPTSPSTSPNTMPTFSQATALPEDTAIHQRTPARLQRVTRDVPASPSDVPVCHTEAAARPREAPSASEGGLDAPQQGAREVPARPTRSQRGSNAPASPQHAAARFQCAQRALARSQRGLTAPQRDPRTPQGRHSATPQGPNEVLQRAREVPVRPSYGTVRPSEAPTRPSEAPARP